MRISDGWLFHILHEPPSDARTMLEDVFSI